jgi:hypothetical protein
VGFPDLVDYSLASLFPLKVLGDLEVLAVEARQEIRIVWRCWHAEILHLTQSKSKLTLRNGNTSLLYIGDVLNDAQREVESNGAALRAAVIVDEVERRLRMLGSARLCGSNQWLRICSHKRRLAFPPLPHTMTQSK